MKIPRNLIFILLSAAVVITAAAGCGSPLVFGPYPFEATLGDGAIDPADFETKSDIPVPVVLRSDLCQLPTEADFEAGLAEVLPNLSGSLSIHEVRLRKVILTGDAPFSMIRAMDLRYAGTNAIGIPEIPVNLGVAYSITGFGEQIELTPIGNVDLLELIRDNDQSPGQCPELWAFLVAATPEEAVAWHAEAEVDIYVALR